MKLSIYLVCVLPVAFALLALTCARADSIYRWVDKDGHVHYTQTPPPGTQSAPMVINAPAPDTTGAQATQNLEQSMNKQNQKAAEAAQEAAQETQKKAEMQKACDTMRQQLQDLENTRRAQVATTNGGTAYYSGDDLIKLRQELQDRIAKNCSG